MNSKLKKARVGNVFHLISFFLMLLGVPNAGVSQESKVGIGNMDKSVVKSEQEWKGCLTSEEYRILREKGTEMAFTGKYTKHNEDGVYKCAGCGEELFSSETKYDSGSGWPSFWKIWEKRKPNRPFGGRIPNELVFRPASVIFALTPRI